MLRRLVTVRRVNAVDPIPKADRIQLASIDGWRCIVAKSEFCAGDLGVYFEIDSFLPASDERWAFLAKDFITNDDRKGYRVRTLKMRGQISQGLLMPLGKFPEITAQLQELSAEIGRPEAEARIMDQAFEDLLGVTKYERPDVDAHPGSGPTDFCGDMPPFIRRTEQYRCQNLPRLFEEYADATFQETTKMDGSSMTVYFVRSDSPFHAYLPPLDLADGDAAAPPGGRVGVASRNRDLVNHPRNLYWDVAKAHDLPAKLAAAGRNVAIQGELCGASIQANFEGFPAGFHDFYLFSVWDIDAQRYLGPREAEQWARDLGIKHVPVNGYFRLGDIAGTTVDLVARADGVGVNGKKREGIVFKHIDGSFSFKAISNSYLLKHGE